MAQRYVMEPASALRVAPLLNRSLLVGLAAGLAVLCAVYAGLGIAFLRALPTPALDLDVPAGAPLSLDAPLVLQTVGWNTRISELRLTEYTLDGGGQVISQRDVPVVYQPITEGRLPGESRGVLVRPDGGPLLTYDARYELVVRGVGSQWSWTGQRSVPLASAAVFTTPLSPRPEYPDHLVLPYGEPLAIGFNVPITSIEYQVHPDVPSRMWLSEDREIAYILLEDPAQGTEYSVEITGAMGASGAPIRQAAVATFHTPAALRVVSVTPDNGARDVAPGLDPVITFSEPVANPDAAEQAISVDPPVDGHFKWLAPNRVQFVTDKGFPYSTNIELTVRPGPDGLRSANGGYLEQPSVLAYRTRVNKHIDVDLRRQQVSLLEDGVVVYRTVASTGVRGAETPTGNFTIQYKMPKTRMRGTNPDGHSYDIPDVPWVMAMFGDYTFHGAPWRQAWGVPLSNGCVSMPTANAKYVYDWTPVGTTVSIHY